MQYVASVAIEKVRDEGTRNKLLLGVAGVAITVALGIACQKRIRGILCVPSSLVWLRQIDWARGNNRCVPPFVCQALK
jgi:hypothetical protein